jgi:preprotein translocase subunit SecE
MEAVEKIRTFLNEVKIETKKTSWPTREELRGSTWVVIVAVFIITVLIAVIDLILNRVLGLLINV